jgi:hypothetical protein
MKKLLLILVFTISAFANDDYCQKLYDGFKSVLEPQMTSLCSTNVPGTFTYSFYFVDDSSFTDMKLVFSVNGINHLYQRNVEKIPFTDTDCITNFEDTKTILSTLFITHTCSKEYKNLRK